MVRDKCAFNIKYSCTNYVSVTGNVYLFTTTRQIRHIVL